MKHSIMAALCAALATYAFTASGEIKLLSEQKAQAIYLDGGGKQLTPGAAIITLAKGGRVLKCTEVEANETKTGISMKAKK